MLYMVIETFREGAKEKVYERYQAMGWMLPEGLDYVDSWLESSGGRCFQLMRADSPDLFKLWIARWDDLVQFEVVPVSESPTKTE
jgi:hypothetical protein